MKEAMFYKKLKNKKVKCHLCARECEVLEGKTGFCRVRKNINGKLYSLSYEKVISAVPNPIEKKPLYHFAPGSQSFSVASTGCNWRCKYCCNWNISQGEIQGEKISPEELVKMAKEARCGGLSFTFTEPTIFYELSYETAKLAQKAGLYNTWVSNGYTNPEPIKKISPYIDAVTVDFKGSGNAEFLKNFAFVPTSEPIYRALLEWRKQNVHIEITDLLVPKVGDSMRELKQLVKWVKDNLGEETPIHFLRFFPTHLVLDLPETPIETLNKAYNIAKKLGMKYVYTGNVEDEKVNTFCPKCQKLLIKRLWMQTIEYKIKEGKCPFCNQKINIKGEKWIPKSLKVED